MKKFISGLIFGSLLYGISLPPVLAGSGGAANQNACLGQKHVFDINFIKSNNFGNFGFWLFNLTENGASVNRDLNSTINQSVLNSC